MKRTVALVLTGLMVLSPCNGFTAIQTNATGPQEQDIYAADNVDDETTKDSQAEDVQKSDEEVVTKNEDETEDVGKTSEEDAGKTSEDEAKEQPSEETSPDEKEQATDPANSEETKSEDEKDGASTERTENTDTETTEDAAANPEADTRTEENADETPVTDDVQVPQETEENADEKEADKDAEPLQSAAFEYATEVDGFQITISADENVLPDGTRATVKAVDSVNDKGIDSILDEKADNSVISSASFDITFTDAEGKEVQPVEGSSVKLRFGLSADMEALYQYYVEPKIKVMHIDDEAKADEVESELTVVSEGDTVQVMSDDELEELKDEAQAVADSANEVAIEEAAPAEEETDENLYLDENSDREKTFVEPVEDNTGYVVKNPDELEVEVDAESFSVYSVFLEKTYDASNSLDPTTHVFTFTQADLDAGSFQGLVQDALNISRNDIDTLYTIVLPAGEYPVTVNALYISSNTTIDMTAGTTIYGAGDYLNLLCADWRRSSPSEGITKELYPQQGFDTFSNITIKGGTWDGRGATKTGQGTCMIRFAHTTGLTFDGVTFVDAYDSHHVEVAAIRNFTVKNCTFRGYTDKGSSLEAIQLDVTHNATNFVWNNGVYDDLACENVEITGCTFDNLVRGVGSHHSVVGKYYSNVNIHDNTFTNIKGSAIVARNFKNIKIQNNKMIDVGAGVDFRQQEGTLYLPNGTSSTTKDALTYSCGADITGNEIKIATSDKSELMTGIRYGGFELKKGTNSLPTGVYNINGFTISGNKIYGSAERGISAMFCTSATISDNTIEGLTGTEPVGIYVGTATGQIINGNTVKGKDKGNMISVTDDAAADEISGNTLIGGNVGLFIKKSSSAKLVSNNNIYGARKMAVQVQTKCTVNKAVNNFCGSVYKKHNGKKSVYVDKSSKAVFYTDANVKIGKSEKFAPYLVTSDKGKVAVKSSKKKKATATKNEIKAKSKGKTTVTATQNKSKGQMVVTVANDPKSVSVPESTINLAVGDVYRLQPEVNSGAGCGRYTYKSSKKGSAYVTNQGVILANKAGTAKITITTFNKKKCKVTVVIN